MHRRLKIGSFWALRSIRQKSLGCDYLVPDAKSGSIDYKTVNVDFTEGKRVASSFFYVDTADGCDLKPTEGAFTVRVPAHGAVLVRIGRPRAEVRRIASRTDRTRKRRRSSVTL